MVDPRVDLFLSFVVIPNEVIRSEGSRSGTSIPFIVLPLR